MTADGSQSIAGRRVLITGGSSGIGLTVAEELTQRRARVVLVARGEQGLNDAAAKLTGCAGTVAADLSEADAAVAAVQQAAEMLGGLDVVVACVGAGAFGPFEEMAPEDYEQTVRITLLATMHTIHAALPYLDDGGGTLVVVGSVAGRVPVPWLTAYAAAKHGVRGFVRSLDAEMRALRRPVSLALIAPGPVNTPFWRRARTPDGRLPPELSGAYRPEDVAAEVLRAIVRPGPTERTIGGLMAIVELIDAVVPNLILAPLGRLARLAWRDRESRPHSDEDALAQPTVHAEREGGLIGRGSILQKARGAGMPNGRDAAGERPDTPRSGPDPRARD